jgi:hypothetical protein
MVIRQIGTVQPEAGRGMQIKYRSGLGTRGIHRRRGIKSVVSPIVAKRREEHGQRGKSNCDNPEPHTKLCGRLTVDRGVTLALNN